MFTSVEIAEEVKKRVNDDTLPRRVCFDYFDTLVTRRVFPEATKKLAARQLVTVCGEKMGWQTVYELRSGIEKRLCEKSRAAGFDPEFRIDELAEEFFLILYHAGLLPKWIDCQIFINIFISIELKVEMSVQQPCPELFELLRFLHTKKYEIYLVSDFYFSGKQFLKLLEFHKIDNCFSKIFTSADYRLSKGAGGRLYKK